VQVLPYRDIADSASVTPYYEMYMKTQEQMLQGSTLVTHVAETLNSGSKPEEMRSETQRLRSHFGVRRVENSQLIELSYVAPDPEVAASLVNLFAEEISNDRQGTPEYREKATNLRGELKDLQRRSGEEDWFVAPATKWQP
jgi:uncharacterized protein involved in exopolysaccharide biosynthesis